MPWPTRSTLSMLILPPTVLAGALAQAGAAASVVPDPVGEWPLSPAPVVERHFEPPVSRWGPGHRGVDLVGTPGQPVRAALPGSVAFAGRVAGRGVVVVRHGPTRTTYEPVLPTLAVGTTVAAGDVVGRLATAGSHCAPRSCLHWGWVRGETYLDPLDLVGGGPVRLLPLGGLVTDSWTPPVATRAARPAPWWPTTVRPGLQR